MSERDDLKRLWAAVHHYLAAQARGEGVELSRAYSELVDEHNAIYARYIAQDDRAGTLAGVDG